MKRTKISIIIKQIKTYLKYSNKLIQLKMRMFVISIEVVFIIMLINGHSNLLFCLNQEFLSLSMILSN